MKGNNTYINKLNVIGSVNTVHYNERLIHSFHQETFSEVGAQKSKSAVLNHVWCQIYLHLQINNPLN